MFGLRKGVPDKTISLVLYIHTAQSVRCRVLFRGHQMLDGKTTFVCAQCLELLRLASRKWYVCTHSASLCSRFARSTWLWSHSCIVVVVLHHPRVSSGKNCRFPRSLGLRDLQQLVRMPGSRVMDGFESMWACFRSAPCGVIFFPTAIQVTPLFDDPISHLCSSEMSWLAAWRELSRCRGGWTYFWVRRF